MKIVIKNNMVIQTYRDDQCVEKYYPQNEDFEIYYLSNVENIKLNNIIELTEEQKLESLRYSRNKLLEESDFMMLPDVQGMLDIEKKESVRLYRQLLRDLPQTTNLNNVKYPLKPEI